MDTNSNIDITTIATNSNNARTVASQRERQYNRQTRRAMSQDMYKCP